MAPRTLLRLLPAPLLLAASVARANPLFVALDYELEAKQGSCPTEAEFRSMVSAQLGYDPFRSGAALTVVANVRPEAGGHRATIEWYDAAGNRQGERQLSSEDADCAAIARSLGFAIAVQIQLLAKAAEDATPAASASPPQETAQTSSAKKPASPPSPVASDVTGDGAPRTLAPKPWRFVAGVGPFVTMGMAPAAAPGARTFAAVRRDWFSLELGAEATLPARYSMGGAAGIEQHVALGSLAFCLSWGEWSACAVNKVGGLYVRGFGVAEPREPFTTIALAGARLTFGRELGASWLAALRLESLATLGSWDVTLNRRTVWTMPAINLTLGVDIGWFF